MAGKQKWMTSAATARGAVAVKTAIGNITPPPWATRMTAVWVNTLIGALLTTAESVGGILELEGSGIESQAFPTDQENMLTGGDAHLAAHIIPVNIPVSALAPITGSTTMDDTITGAVLHRWGCCFE
jgi:hypothetical protein